MDVGRCRRGRRTSLQFRLLACVCLFVSEAHQVSADSYTSLVESQGSSGEHNFPSLDPEVTEYKRGSSSFFPLRGKKLSLDREEEDKRSQFFPLRGKKIPEELKRASYFMPMRGRKDAVPDYDTADENADKRASSFMPMRGKKEMFEHLSRTGMYSYPSDSHHIEITGKRSSSFMPMRGKRSSQSEEPTANDSTHSVSKRSVSFMPMRGRRELEEDTLGHPGDITTSLMEKKQYAFMPMRGRREMFDSNSNVTSGDALEVDKKAALFMPMRGRRGQDDEFETYDKKAQYFMPMRGRRTHLGEDDDHPGSIEDKRASSFMPMRGRRTSSEFSEPANWTASFPDSEFPQDKRASAFTAMRGRRLSPEEEKRTAFMPMRGRRLYSDMEDDEDWKVQEWPAEDLISLLNKRSSSFMPMRGRRFDDEEGADADKRASSFMPMRGRRFDDDEDDMDKRASSFMPMRGRRESSDMRDSSSYYNPYPYFLAGIGSSLISRPHGDRGISFSPIRSAATKKRRFKINWDSVKRAFHATRGKRLGEVDDFVNSLKDSYLLGARATGVTEQEKPSRRKRSLPDLRVALQPQRQYIALKRPMSFFATRGKRLDDSSIDSISKLR